MKTFNNLLFRSQLWRDTMQDNNLVSSMCHLSIILNFASIILNFAFSWTRTQVTWAFTLSYFNIIM
jgi:hypothetical protein